MLAAGRARQTDPTITLNAIPDEAVTLPEILQRAGYRTFGVADNLNICAAEGFDQGFDAFQSYNYRGAAAVNAQVVDWTTEILQPESPYFLYVHYMDPHKPYGHRQPWSSQLGATGTADISAYDSEIRHVDEHIRTLFETMGWKDNTIVVVTSDHGEEFGDHGEFGHGHNLYNETLQVPLLVYPASALGWNGGRVGESVSLIDLLPTLREIAGAQPAAHEEGLSLLVALRGESRSLEERGEIFAHLQRTRLEYRNGEELVSRAAISGTRKYLRRGTCFRPTRVLPRRCGARSSTSSRVVSGTRAFRNRSSWTKSSWRSCARWATSTSQRRARRPPTGPATHRDVSMRHPAPR
jgi:arylsulfatase A-like enzyme